MSTRPSPRDDGSSGPTLVHVDAYRLGSLDEVDALDLDASLDEAVTVVEWGEGWVESLAQDRLEVTLQRPRGGALTDDDLDDAAAGERVVTVRGVGARWADVVLPGADAVHGAAWQAEVVPVLALDTSAAVAVALTDDSGDPLAARSDAQQRHHAELLTPMIAAVLAEAGVDRRELASVVVGTGPAPFTGLRVGLVTARTLALALGSRRWVCPSLDAVAAAGLARAAGRHRRARRHRRASPRGVLGALPARASRAASRSSPLPRSPRPRTSPPTPAPPARSPLGRGAALYADVLGAGPVDARRPRAAGPRPGGARAARAGPAGGRRRCSTPNRSTCAAPTPCRRPARKRVLG